MGKDGQDEGSEIREQEGVSHKSQHGQVGLSQNDHWDENQEREQDNRGGNSVPRG